MFQTRPGEHAQQHANFKDQAAYPMQSPQKRSWKAFKDSYLFISPKQLSWELSR